MSSSQHARRRRFVLFATLATLIAGCGGGNSDSNSLGSPSSSTSQEPPSSAPVGPLIAGSPRLPANMPPNYGSASPGIRNTDGTVIKPVYASVGSDSPAAAFVASLSAIDLSMHTLSIAGTNIGFDDKTSFANRAGDFLRAGNVVQVDALPIDLTHWQATRVTFIADSATPGALTITLSGRAQVTNTDVVKLGTTTIDIAALSFAAKNGAWLTAQTFDDGGSVLRATAVSAFGLDAAQSGQEVMLAGPAFLDGNTLVVAGVPVHFVAGVNVADLQLSTLQSGDVVTVAGIVSDDRTFVYGTDARR